MQESWTGVWSWSTLNFSLSPSAPAEQCGSEAGPGFSQSFVELLIAK